MIQFKIFAKTAYLLSFSNLLFFFVLVESWEKLFDATTEGILPFLKFPTKTWGVNFFI